MEDGLKEEDNPYSEEGKILHELYFTGRRPSSLTVDQVRTLDEADALTNQFFDWFCNAAHIPDDAEFVDHREVPLEMRAAGGVLFRGHVDLIREWPSSDARAIVDFKSGFVEVDSAEQNDQLAAYAVMKQQQRAATRVGVCIVQPNNFGPRMSQTAFLPEDLRERFADLILVYEQQLYPKAPLIPGEKQCRNCKARAMCPSYRAQFVEIEQYKTRAVDLLDNEELAQVLTMIRMAEGIKDTVTDEMRKRIEANRMPGWKLRNTGDTRTCKDPLALFNALTAYLAMPGVAKDLTKKFTATAFDACREVGWGKLAIVIGDICGIGKKPAEKLLKDIAEPYTLAVPKAKSPMREKDAS